jgi:hypothetical protein
MSRRIRPEEIAAAVAQSRTRLSRDLAVLDREYALRNLFVHAVRLARSGRLIPDARPGWAGLAAGGETVVARLVDAVRQGRRVIAALQMLVNGMTRVPPAHPSSDEGPSEPPPP